MKNADVKEISEPPVQFHRYFQILQMDCIFYFLDFLKIPFINTIEKLASVQEFLVGFRLNRSPHILGSDHGNETISIRYDFATGVILDTTAFYLVFVFCLSM